MSGPIRIIAIDPGSVCGIAVYHTHMGKPFFASGEYDSLNVTPEYVRAWLAEGGHWIVVVERFTLGSRSVMSAQYEALYTIGALRYVSSLGNATFELQSRSEAKKIASNTVLKRIGWYTKTKDDHANDAARHLLLGLTVHHPLETVSMLDLV